jgi:predicted lipoprotein with Yx(FWY)xxD motif
MTRSRTITLTAAAVTLALTVAACGSPTPDGSAAGGYPPAAAATASAPAQSAAAVTGAVLGPGTALVDGTGRALYLFENDTGSTSTCTGACPGVWPPMPAPTGPAAVTSPGTDAQLGSTSRGDGTAQLTYHGHPLYHYIGDEKPGDTRGQGLNQFGAHWYLVQPDGTKLDND